MVHCIGDSHVTIFNRRKLFTVLHGVYFNVTAVQGATVSGLDNPNSKTNAGKIFRKLTNKLKEDDVVLFLLGEVDLGFVIWWRQQHYKASLDDMYNQAFNNYCKLLSSANICKKILVLSVPLPTISDNVSRCGSVANLRREVTATQMERTQLTLKFNRDLKEYCAMRNYNFIDLDPLSIDKETGLVKPELLNNEPTDHHYNGQYYANIIQENIRNIIPI